MIRFVTLFLGILVGTHDVAVMVGDDVAAVEILLNGQPAARIEGEPWTASVDFGAALETHLLEAVAYDAAGAELDRTRQFINRPRPPAEVELLLERDANGRPVAVRVEWQSIDHERPDEVHVTLDGDRLLELEPHRFGLPRVDPQKFHLVQADVRFGDGLRAHTETTFGGEYLEEARGELTAVLVRLAGGGRAPRPERMTGWFVADGAPLEVVAVEEGPIELLIVRSEGAATAIAKLEGLGFAGSGSAGGAHAIAKDAPQMRTALELPKHYRLRLMAARATRVSRGNLSFEAFLVSPSLTPSMGVYWALWQRFRIASPSPQPRLADAVATAGLQAAAGKRRRAVVLATGEATPDFSTVSPAVATDYLRRLEVPLYVWHIGPARPPPGWPEATAIVTFPDLKKAVRAVRKEIERQRVIWLDHSHDPRDVRLVDRSTFARVGAGD